MDIILRAASPATGFAAFLCGAALLLSAPAAEARCPRAATGTFSGLFTTDSFNASVGHTDSSTGLARITLAADGTFSVEVDSKNSLEPTGESGTLSGTYSFSTSNCSGQLMLGSDLYRFRLTDSGRLLNGIRYNQADTSQQDVFSFQFFRE